MHHWKLVVQAPLKTDIMENNSPGKDEKLENQKIGEMHHWKKIALEYDSQGK